MTSGILLLNKPSGISSNQALQKVKKILNIKKAGHFGTLDPLAQGLLILGINYGTKLSAFLLNEDKEYEATIHLGITTDTDDSDGKIISSSNKTVSNFAVVEALKQIMGIQYQVPPRFSAIKVEGKKLYEYARKGQEIVIKAREVNIKKCELVKFEFPILELKLKVSKGTYIRSIARDLGESLGIGAHITNLTRTRQGIFDLQDAVNLEKISQYNILELDQIFPNCLNLEISDSELIDLHHGRRPQIASLDATLVILKHSGKVAGLARIENNELIKEFLV
ncbi:MAG: tRNA pseudouridine synthase [Pseudomonadota bacterium]